MSLLRSTRRALIRRYSSPVAVGGWSPLDLPDLEAWWDFADAATLYTDAGSTLVSADGQSIYRANDKSGNGRHLNQSTSGNRPVYKTGIFNGQSVARFSDNQWLLTGGESYAAQTVVAVFKKDDATFPDYDGIITCRASGSYKTSNSNEFVLIAGVLNENALSGGATATGAYLDGGSVNLTNYNFYATGVTLSPATSPHIISHIKSDSVSGAKYFGVGGDVVTDVRNLDGDILEIIILSSVIATADHNLLGEYLADKWGLSWTTVS